MGVVSWYALSSAASCFAFSSERVWPYTIYPARTKACATGRPMNPVALATDHVVSHISSTAWLDFDSPNNENLHLCSGAVRIILVLSVLSAEEILAEWTSSAESRSYRTFYTHPINEHPLPTRPLTRSPITSSRETGSESSGSNKWCDPSKGSRRSNNSLQRSAPHPRPICYPLMEDVSSEWLRGMFGPREAPVKFQGQSVLTSSGFDWNLLKNIS